MENQKKYKLTKLVIFTLIVLSYMSFLNSMEKNLTTIFIKTENFSLLETWKIALKEILILNGIGRFLEKKKKNLR